MQPVRIRTATGFDQKALEALQWRASLNNPGDREALLANPNAITLPLQQIKAGGVFTAVTAGSIVGFAAILPRADGDADLDALFVEPVLWRQGIGRLLVEHCCLIAKRGGAAALHVVGNPHAEGFYQASEFRLVGSQQMQFGVGLVMVRNLC